MRLNKKYQVIIFTKPLYYWHNILDKFPCSLPTSVEVSAMLVTLAGLVIAIPVGAGVVQEFPGSINAAPCGLGVGAERLGCAEIPRLRVVEPWFLR